MTDGIHRLPIRIYYEDTDFSGVVYHANYLRFMERGRTEFLRDRGIEQARLTDETGGSLAFVVRQITIDFRKPARMDDQVWVETVAGEHGHASLILQQRVVRDGEALVTATVKIALVGGGRARRLPAGLATALLAPSSG